MRQNSLVKEKTIEAARKRIPFFVHLDLTYQCNLECAHCYVVKENRPEMTTSKIKKLLEELADMGTLYLQLSGGEIFLRKDFFEIAEYARKLHFALRISTNGTLIDEKTADKIASLYPERVSISVYSTNPQVHDRITGVNGSLENTINCARLLLERNVGVRFNCVIMNQNFNDYHKVYELAESMGAIFQGDPQVTPKLNGDTSTLSYQMNYEQLYQVRSDPIFESQEVDNSPDIHLNLIPEEFPCFAAHSFCYINPYGDVFPCAMFPLKCGNINDSLKDIWYNSSQMINSSKIKISELSECNKCKIQKYCRYCPGLAYIETGNPSKPTKIRCREAEIIKKIKGEI